MKHILVIDDSPFVIDAVRDALEPDGIEVAGLAAVDELDPASELDEVDLILLDVQLSPVVDDTISGVMRRRARSTAPVLLLSSLPEGELAARTQASGVDGYILKERGVDEVADEVRAWLDGRKERHRKGP
jgi:DNA-binding NarL/FixJ family response regulator